LEEEEEADGDACVSLAEDDGDGLVSGKDPCDDAAVSDSGSDSEEEFMLGRRRRRMLLAPPLVLVLRATRLPLQPPPVIDLVAMV
jgi:hypothetical protein